MRMIVILVLAKRRIAKIVPHTYLRLVILPMDEGMGPVNLLSCKSLFMRNRKMSVILVLILAKRRIP